MPPLHSLLSEIMEIDEILLAVLFDPQGLPSFAPSPPPPLPPDPHLFLLATACETLGRSLLLGSLRQTVMEFELGLIFLAPLRSSPHILALLASSHANLGLLRAQIHLYIPRIQEALSQQEAAS